MTLSNHLEPLSLFHASLTAILLNILLVAVWWTLSATVGRYAPIGRVLFSVAAVLLVLGCIASVASEPPAIGFVLISAGLSGVAVMWRWFDELWA